MKRYKIVKTIIAKNLTDAMKKDKSTEICEAFESEDQEDIPEEHIEIKGFNHVT